MERYSTSLNVARKHTYGSIRSELMPDLAIGAQGSPSLVSFAACIVYTQTVIVITTTNVADIVTIT
jgi:hypothetical protein